MNQRDAQHYIETRQTFTASALSGIQGRSNYYGQLNSDEIAKYEGVKDSIDYVVMSYQTPIAWHSASGWYVVSQKFSVTTSKHCNQVRRATTSEMVGAI